MLVGDRATAPRTRFGGRDRPTAGHDLEHGLGLHQAPAQGGRGRPDPVRGGGHPRRRRARLAPRVHETGRGRRARPQGADRDGRPHPPPRQERQGRGARQAAGPGPGPYRVRLQGLAQRPREGFRKRVEVATLDPFHGCKNAIDDQLADATAVLDAFHVVKLGTQAVDEVRRRVQQDTLGHRGRKNDPLYRVRNNLRAGRENLTDKQKSRLNAVFTAREEHREVEVAWSCAQLLRSAYHQKDHAAGKVIAEQIT
ncbi:MAG: transposase [Actinobacteria bacterium]|nr:transposase [Actinomycetota bacterium]